MARFGAAHVHYWRDKQQHEVDFVLQLGRRREVLAIECKSSASKFEPAGLQSFRRKHPRGANLVVTLRDTEHYTRIVGELEVEYLPFSKISAYLDTLRGKSPKQQQP
ncbi:MAG: DUF4143 domain-containing protein [Deltaproteobacteria bacterium]